jgi:16S rRNA (cytidine1402-2'-O)-methyltransferase
MVFFESVHRLTEALIAMAAAFGPDRPAALCRELTKTYEEVRRGTLAELVMMAQGGVRGEVTLVVGGATEPAEAVTDEVLAAAVVELVAAGGSRRDAVDAVAARYGIARRVVYAAATRR